jgi:beta-glucosidase
MDDHALINRFPKDFIFGVATASYQIEGAVAEDGRKPSIWDAFCAIPGRVVGRDSGAIACDHYHRYREDIRLIAGLGVDAYRFSFAWPRIIPDGRGAVNEKGLDFYDRLIDEMLRWNLQPFATLYHWDLPIGLHGIGGWTVRDTALAFADYAELIARRFGDRLATLTTHNEPWCSAFLGYLYGIHAPGERDLSAMLHAAHHLNLAHGLGVAAIRASAPSLPVGIVLNAKSIYPATTRPADIAAAKRYDTFHNGVFLDPIFKGAYDPALLEAMGPAMPEVLAGDLAAIAAPLDYLGINYYTPDRVVADPSVAYPAAQGLRPPADARVTAMGWEVCADGFTHLIRSLRDQYTLPPIYITENGAGYHDTIVDGVVDDQNRLVYYREHLGAVADMIEQGLDVRGYFAWSLMDNFEWAEGYAKRFGLIYVDYATQQRTLKASGQWYSDLVSGRQQAASHRKE